jgi:4-hydroxy-3-methylbut-2-enyl diphosphate reductase
VELCEKKLPTYYIESEAKILSAQTILHYDFHNRVEVLTENYLPHKNPARVLITSGASCPDAVVEAVITKLAQFYPGSKSIDEMAMSFS